ncbi:MAG: hypothetical protein QOC66_1222, partial [Pseudonocardiales bacterium]|nr:hypothetical protein [Pseudonocardiales bacterium]
MMRTGRVISVVVAAAMVASTATVLGATTAGATPALVVRNAAGDPSGTAGDAGDGGLATAASLNFPSGLAFDQRGRLYIADSVNNRIRRIDGDGVITNFAGDPAGTAGNDGDGGSAGAAHLSAPDRIALDAAGNAYVSDYGNNRVRRIAPNGVITDFAGRSDGQPGNTGDEGAATEAALNHPRGLAVDVHGNVFIADSDNHRVRVVDPTGTIHNFAGDATATAGNDGDGGPARIAHLDGPVEVAVGPSGDVYISEWTRHRVRKVDTAGTISNVAGSLAGGGSSGDGGPATSARLDLPSGLAFDPAGNLYIADHENNRVRRVDAAGTITTFAGNPFNVAGNAGDGGAPRNALLDHPAGLAFDGRGRLHIADSHNNRVRAVVSSDATPPAVTIDDAPSGQVLTGDAGIAFTATDDSGDVPATTCTLDGAPATPCTSPVQYTGLATGHHSFVVTATDAAGNAASASAEWDVATTSTVTLRATDPDGVPIGGVCWTTDGDPSAPVCDDDHDGVASTAVANGDHTFATQSRPDYASPAPQTVSVSGDTTVVFVLNRKPSVVVHVVNDVTGETVPYLCLVLSTPAGGAGPVACDSWDGADGIVVIDGVDAGDYTLHDYGSTDGPFVPVHVDVANLDLTFPTHRTPPTPAVLGVDTGAGDQYDPHISGTTVSYTSDFTIRFGALDGSASSSPVPPDPTGNDLLSDVSGSTITFSRLTASGARFIARYDLGTGATTPLPGGTNQLGAGIGGPTVAFIDFTAQANGELFVDDIATGSRTRLTNDITIDQNPQVSPDGNVVVWERCAASIIDCDVWEVVRTAGTWGSPTPVAATAQPEGNPDTDGTTVVYDAWPDSSHAIVQAVPVAGGAATTLDLGGHVMNPAVSRGYVTVERTDDPANPADIWGWDLLTGQVKRITATASVNESLNDVSVDADGSVHVVWASDEDGPDQRNVRGTTFSRPTVPSRLTVRVTSDADGSLVGSACLRLAGGVVPTSIDRCDADGDGVTVFDDLGAGDWTLSVTQEPPGHGAAAPQSVAIDGDTTATVVLGASPAAASFSIDPLADTEAGEPFTVVARAVDAGGSPVPSFTGQVSLAAVVPAGGAGFAAPVAPVAAVAGVATFTGVALDNAADGYRLTAAGGSVSGTSNPFKVTASHLDSI